MISVIIPTLNEQTALHRLLPTMEGHADIEVIVVDGGSSDYTCDIAAAHANRLVCTEQGRGTQMNRGARIAHGDILLFLHADSRLPDNWITLITDAMADPTITWGAFALGFDDDRIIFRLISMVANWRSHVLKTPYGDQGIFVRKDIFNTIGGFPAVPILEDLLIAITLKKTGKISLIPQHIITAIRKWEKCGIMTTILVHSLVTVGFYLGVQPSLLKQLHDRHISKL